MKVRNNSDSPDIYRHSGATFAFPPKGVIPGIPDHIAYDMQADPDHELEITEVDSTPTGIQKLRFVSKKDRKGNAIYHGGKKDRVAGRPQEWWTLKMKMDGVRVEFADGDPIDFPSDVCDWLRAKVQQFGCDLRPRTSESMTFGKGEGATEVGKPKDGLTIFRELKKAAQGEPYNIDVKTGSHKQVELMGHMYWAAPDAAIRVFNDLGLEVDDEVQAQANLLAEIAQEEAEAELRKARAGAAG